MKILFLMSSGFDRHSTSEHLLTAVIEALCRDGHSVHILQRATGGPLPAIPESLKGFPVTTEAIPFSAAEKGNLIARYVKGIQHLRACGKRIAPDFDAAFIQSTPVGGWAVRMVRRRLPKARITFNVQDIFPYNAVYSGNLKESSPVFRLLARLQRRAYTGADQIITISEDMKRTLAEAGAPENRISVVYNWSYQDGLYEQVDTAPVRHMFDPAFFNVVYAGNIGVMQNVDILLGAAELMRADEGVRFHIVGSGAYREKLEARAKEKGLDNLSFWPMQPPELAPAVYSAADVNVIPLVKNVYRTALPSKTATCLACQRPIIFAVGRESLFGQLAQREAGCPVTESDSPQELADAIRALRKGGSSRAGEFFLKYFSRTQNSRRYAGIITGGRRGE